MQCVDRPVAQALRETGAGRLRDVTGRSMFLTNVRRAQMQLSPKCHNTEVKIRTSKRITATHRTERLNARVVCKT